MSEKDLDRFIGDLDKHIQEEMKQRYSPTVLDHFYHPRNLVPLDDFNGHARVTGSCGETMEIWLLIDKEKISKAAFMTNGCGPSLVCGSMVTELAIGTSIEEALDIHKKEILNALGGLPEESEHCASLAAQTLHEAIGNFYRAAPPK